MAHPWHPANRFSLSTSPSYCADNEYCRLGNGWVNWVKLGKLYALHHLDAAYSWWLVSWIISRTLGMYVMYLFLIGIMFIPDQWNHILLSRTDRVVKEVTGFTAAGWSAHGLMEGGEG